MLNMGFLIVKYGIFDLINIDSKLFNNWKTFKLKNLFKNIQFKKTHLALI
jgi:hypothetical protein